jgi:hypothetical protein
VRDRREDGLGVVVPHARSRWGYAWASLNSLVGLVGALSAWRRPVRWRGVLLVEGGRTGLAWVLRVQGFKAITLGHVIVTTEQVDDHILAHELGHVTQHERWGPLFYPAYLLTSMTGYRRNPFEHQAERRALEALARLARGEPASPGEAAPPAGDRRGPT